MTGWSSPILSNEVLKYELKMLLVSKSTSSFGHEAPIRTGFGERVMYPT